MFKKQSLLMETSSENSESASDNFDKIIYQLQPKT